MGLKKPQLHPPKENGRGEIHRYAKICRVSNVMRPYFLESL